MPDLLIEQNYSNQLIAGVDEAGRGPLAGPVVAAAVIIDQQNIIPGINDSKLLSKQQRDILFTLITSHYQYAVGIVDVAEIDQINILEATKKACILAVNNLIIQPKVVIVDGNMKFDRENFISIIKGDTKSISIAAASIVAKVTRDKIMTQLHHEFPHYLWSKNSGYGTKDHINAISKYGRSIYHRQSFIIKKIL